MKKELEDFIEVITNILSGKYKKYGKYCGDDEDSFSFGISDYVNLKINKEYLELKIHRGGANGGNCWNDNVPERYTTDVGSIDFVPLYDILEKLCPNVSFLSVRKLTNLIETEEKKHYEYYGNYTTYEIMKLSVEKFHKWYRENV